MATADQSDETALEIEKMKKGKGKPDDGRKLFISGILLEGFRE